MYTNCCVYDDLVISGQTSVDTDFTAGTRCDVSWPWGGHSEHPQRQDLWYVDEEVVSVAQAPWQLHHRLPRQTQVTPGGAFVLSLSTAISCARMAVHWKWMTLDWFCVEIGSIVWIWVIDMLTILFIEKLKKKLFLIKKSLLRSCYSHVWDFFLRSHFFLLKLTFSKTTFLIQNKLLFWWILGFAVN